MLVGVPLSPAYGEALRRLAEDLAPGGVRFESGISAERLAEHYRNAHGFLCLSEHEGFCIPLLESFHFRVPVVARPVGAVGEVVGDAGVLLSEDDDPDMVAEVLRIVVGTPSCAPSSRPAASAGSRPTPRAHFRGAARRGHSLAAGMSEAGRARTALSRLGFNRSALVRRLIRLGSPRLRELRARAIHGSDPLALAMRPGLRWLEGGVLRVPQGRAG